MPKQQIAALNVEGSGYFTKVAQGVKILKKLRLIPYTFNQRKCGVNLLSTAVLSSIKMEDYKDE